MRRFHHPGPLGKIHFTSREPSVLNMVVNGQGNEEIAGELGVGVETVKNHLRHIFAKTGVSGRAQAAVWTIRE
jgi:DNA-binding NarL/FixJ family response regulator